MAKAVAISFEGDRVKILHASLRGKHVCVHKTEVLPDTEFDACLMQEKAAEFVVVCNFRNSFHDVLSLPAVKPAYLRRIVESEIRKSTARKDLTFIFSHLGDRFVDKRKMMDVFYIAVSNEEIAALVERFHRCGKTVKALYPSVCAAVSLFDSRQRERAGMGVLGIGTERLLFLTQNGAIHLIRNYEALEPELTDFDIQNITMTVNYCFQNLRMNPASIVLIGEISETCGIGSLPSAPLSSLAMPESIKCSPERFNEFVLPAAALLTPGASSILSRDYRNLYALRTWMTCAGRAFAASAALCLCLIILVWNNIAEKRDLIELAGRTITGVNAVSEEYRARRQSMELYERAVWFINQPSPDLGRLMSVLGRQDVRELRLDSIDVTARESNVMLLAVSGSSRLDGYTASQAALDRLADSLGKTEGVKVTDKMLDMADRSFRIELEYR